MSVKCVFTRECSTSVWPQHGTRVAGSGRDFDPLCAVLDIIGRTWRRDEMIKRDEFCDIISKKRKGHESVTSMCVCERACVRVRLTEPCAGGQWVCTVWSSAAAWRWGFREVARALLLAKVQAQATLVLWATINGGKNEALGNTHNYAYNAYTIIWTCSEIFHS